MTDKTYKIGDIIDAETVKRFKETSEMAMKPETDLPQPTHYPHLEPQTVYGIVLEDPNLTLFPPEPPLRKLH